MFYVLSVSCVLGLSWLVLIVVDLHRGEGRAWQRREIP